MQFTVDTRNATAFELTALAELIAKLATVAPQEFAEGWTVQRAPSGAMVASGSTPLTIAPGDVVNSGPDSQSGNAPAAGAPALPADASLVPAIPPAPGATSAAAAPESTSPPAVPAAPSSAPAVPASPSAAAPVAGQVELDSAGCPWSPLIHTSNKATIGDGTWRKKPGVDPAYYESVRNELMGKQTASTATETATSTPNPTSAPASAVPEVPEAPALLTGNDVMARAMEIQMADGTKSAALFQAIQGAGISAGPMGLPGCTDQAVLAAALAAVNAVGAQ